MTNRRRAFITGVLLALGTAAHAQTLIPGGGKPAKADCFVEWRSNAPATKTGTAITCVDGASCDADGQADGACTFELAVCVQQTNVPGCTQQPLIGPPIIKAPPAFDVLQPPADLTTAGCGAPTTIRLPLGRTNGKCRKAKSAKFTMTARSSGKPRKDVDKLTLVCRRVPASSCRTTPTTTTTTTLPPPIACSDNPAGGPRELKLTTVAGGVGGDLDNGWNGGAHNFPIGGSAILDFCLTDCGGADTSCAGAGATGAGTVNGPTFGAPLPLIAATPVCVVNRFDGNISVTEADFQSGAVTANVNLLADVYITSASEVCPQCSGTDVGTVGKCTGGRNAGKDCTVHGKVHVEDAASNDKEFELSADCPPSGTVAGTIQIGLDPFTTGLTVLNGSRPCPGQPRDDNCAPGTCTASCNAQASRRGGIPQFCCSNAQSKPCFPTAATALGKIERAGAATVPTPQGSFPARSAVTLAAVFCEPATGSPAIDGIAAGLPGPGALLQPMEAEWR